MYIHLLRQGCAAEFVRMLPAAFMYIGSDQNELSVVSDCTSIEICKKVFRNFSTVLMISCLFLL